MINEHWWLLLLLVVKIEFYPTKNKIFNEWSSSFERNLIKKLILENFPGLKIKNPQKNDQKIIIIKFENILKWSMNVIQWWSELDERCFQQRKTKTKKEKRLWQFKLKSDSFIYHHNSQTKQVNNPKKDLKKKLSKCSKQQHRFASLKTKN